MIAKRCYFSGQVQGVGFRWRTRGLLATTGVAGYVRNLIDGRVELFVQGDRPTVEQAISLVRAELSMYIDAVVEDDCETESERIDFCIER